MYTAGERYHVCRYLSLNNFTRYSRKRMSPFLRKIGTGNAMQVPETEVRCTYAEQMNTERPQKLEL
jgi:hypothetical protein